MTKGKQQEAMFALRRAINDYMDFRTCNDKNECIMFRSHDYFQIPVFVTYLCHFLSAMPFETYRESQAYEVIKELDNRFKHMTALKQKLDVLEQKCLETQFDLKYMHSLYRNCCHALMTMVMYQFRAFWCKLYNLNAKVITMYKLFTTKKLKEKDFKARKQTNGDSPLFFTVTFHQQPVAKTFVAEMERVYKQLYDERSISEIPAILTRIKVQFASTVEEHNRDIGEATDMDDEEEGDTEVDTNHEEEEDDDDDDDVVPSVDLNVEEDVEMKIVETETETEDMNGSKSKAKGKGKQKERKTKKKKQSKTKKSKGASKTKKKGNAKKGKKKQTKSKSKRRRGRKKKLESEDEYEEDEEKIVYAETSSEDDNDINVNGDESD